MIRTALYSVLITIAICIPRSQTSEIPCEYSYASAFSYIAGHVGLIQKDKPKIMRGGVCNTYLGAPLIYVADFYDSAAIVSIKNLFLNIISVVFIVELLFFFVLALKRLFGVGR